MSDSALNYQQLLTDTLQSQMVILGPAITLAKAKNVSGLHVNNEGRVTGIDGNPQEVSIKLLEQFRELSPLMVKKTMRPLLNAIITAYPTAEGVQPSEGHAQEMKPAEPQLNQNEHSTEHHEEPTPAAVPDAVKTDAPEEHTEDHKEASENKDSVKTEHEQQSTAN